MITNLRHACITPDSRQQCPKCNHIEGGNVGMSLLMSYYAGTLGLKVVYMKKEVWNWNKQRVEIRVCKFAAPGQEETGPYLELVDGNWGAHIAFSVDEFPEDVKLSRPIREGGHDNDVEIAFTMDPAGNMIELVKEGKK